MFEKIRVLAMEKLASKEEVDAFMEGFEKTASLGSIYAAFNSFDRNNQATNILKENAGKAAIGLGAALLGAAIVKSISSGSQAVGNYHLRGKFDTALAQVMATNKIVKGYPHEKTKGYANTLFHFAPHIASDPHLLSSILANAVQGEGMDQHTMSDLVQLEGRFRDNGRANPFAGIRV